MKRILAVLTFLTIASSVGADDAMYIIREYRPFCRTRVTEITRVEKIQPIDRPVVLPKRCPVCYRGFCFPLIEKIDAREELEKKQLKK